MIVKRIAAWTWCWCQRASIGLYRWQYLSAGGASVGKRTYLFGHRLQLFSLAENMDDAKHGLFRGRMEESFNCDAH